MEEDIWFVEKPQIQNDPKKIVSFLPHDATRDIMLNGQLFHSHVWEGAQLIHGDIVRNAINFGVNFSYVQTTFLDNNREQYEKEFGGPIAISMYHKPDTFDEFGLYCALRERTKIEHDTKAAHLRG